jgi:hypothetical protein
MSWRETCFTTTFLTFSFLRAFTAIWRALLFFSILSVIAVLFTYDS